ncbi:MAG: 2-dehydro-3-deoxygalactonokinase [Rhodobacteraceae bacterium]|nr:2-dehydro-3-deoxygalactonokinase [Paracoccaceae bacterium]
MSGGIGHTSWIAVDWGTSNLRVWGMSGDGTVLAEHRSDKGMARLTRETFEPALLDLIGDALPEGGQKVPVMICGMAGARQGWAEAPYLEAPCSPPGPENATRVATRDPRIAVYILPGIKQLHPADVMRGEETQIAGFLSGQPDFDGVLCLPGTHTKWVRISAGEVVSFQTCMTGELFDLVATQSVVAQVLQGAGWDDTAFREAVDDALSKPQMLAARLFNLRARGLLEGQDPATGRARLSGYLIGSELSATRPYWLGANVAVLGAESLSRHYCAALSAQGVTALAFSGEDLVLTGLRAAMEKMSKEFT